MLSFVVLPAALQLVKARTARLMVLMGWTRAEVVSKARLTAMYRITLQHTTRQYK